MKKKDIRILLVDDEPDILEIIGYNLSAEGYDIYTAKNGADGVAKAKEENATPYYTRRDDARNGWHRSL